jgi:hypothetical protein
VVSDANAEIGAITAARAEHFFPTYIYALRNMTPARKASIDKEIATPPNALSVPRDALARSISKVSNRYRFWGDPGTWIRQLLECPQLSR